MKQLAFLTLGLGLFVVGCATGGGDIIGDVDDNDGGGAGDGGSPSTGGNPNTNNNNTVTGNTNNNTVTTDTVTSTNTATSTGSMGCSGFLCSNGQCIGAAQECDNTQHCADGSDEAPFNPSCPSTNNTTGTGGGGCDPFFEVTCGDGSCVFIFFVCDGLADCADSSDEAGCSGGAPAEWICPDTYYNAADGCDCGCGAPDPDCASASVNDCEYCEDGCSASVCPGTIDPANNAFCL
jgi:hypothetical protein